MTIRFDEPAWLLAAALALPMVLVASRAFASMSPVRRWSAVVLRAALMGLIAATLAGVSSVRRTNKVAVIAVVDVSGSVRRYAGAGAVADAAADGSSGTASVGRRGDPVERVKTFLARATAGRGPEDLLGAVVFDAKSAAVATPTRGDVLGRDFDIRPSGGGGGRDGGGTSETSGLGAAAAEGTDIASAIRLARAMVPADATGRIVLFSDGNQTAGDALTAAREAAGGSGALYDQAAARIDVVPMRYQIDREVLVESVDAPPIAGAEAVVPIRVVLSSTGASSGTLRVFKDGKPVAMGPGGGGSGGGGGAGDGGRRLTIGGAGLHVERVEVKLDKGRIHRFRAVYEPDPIDDGAGGQPGLSGDTVAENNHGESFTITPGTGAVLLVDGVSGGEAGGAGSTLAGSLRAAGFDIVVIPPGAVPDDVLSLQAYDLIILENVGAEAIGRRAEEQLIAYVRDLGGGLVMVGGPNSFGAGGWIGSNLEKILPVALELPDKLVTPEAATVFVLDNSGSMFRPVLGSARTQQEIANDACALAIRSLDTRDMVGVISFNTDTEVVVPLGPNAEPKKTGDRVRDISPGGGTNVVPALIQAGEWLGNTNAKVRHVVVLSDGMTRDPRGRSPVLICAGLKAQGLQVSCIAVGDGADLAQMSGMAQAGGGVFYHAINADVLPQLFMRVVRVIRTPMVREETFTPVLLPAGGGSAMASGLSSFPPLGGLALTQARPEPTIVNVLATPGGEPLLSHWNVGLGQVVAFTSDAHRWAKPWLDWPGYARLWSQIVRSASRPPTGRMFQASADVSADGVRLRLEATDDDGKPIDELSVAATVFSPSGEQQQVRLSQTQPGVYEGRGSAREPGSYVAVVKPVRGDRILTPVVVGGTMLEGDEYRHLSSDDALLKSIAAAAGGRVLDPAEPGDAKLFDRANIRPREAFAPLWHALMVAAIVALLLDIATRRVAWDRWVSGRFGNDLSTAAHELTRSRDAAPALAVLRAATAESDERVRPVDAIALSRADADRLAAAARDRRRSVGRAQSSLGSASTNVDSTGTAPAATVMPDSTPAASEATPPADASGGLLAAKRRAARRFDDPPA